MSVIIIVICLFLPDNIYVSVILLVLPALALSINTAPPPPNFNGVGGLQDFDTEQEPDNQLHRDDFVENRE